jgi:hypothetical protein
MCFDSLSISEWKNVINILKDPRISAKRSCNTITRPASRWSHDRPRGIVSRDVDVESNESIASRYKGDWKFGVYFDMRFKIFRHCCYKFYLRSWIMWLSWNRGHRGAEDKVNKRKEWLHLSLYSGWHERWWKPLSKSGICNLNWSLRYV